MGRPRDCTCPPGCKARNGTGHDRSCPLWERHPLGGELVRRARLAPTARPAWCQPNADGFCTPDLCRGNGVGEQLSCPYKNLPAAVVQLSRQLVPDDDAPDPAPDDERAREPQPDDSCLGYPRSRCDPRLVVPPGGRVRPQ